MYIKKIQIQNYRSIENMEIDCSNFNVFVGQNNHGKSNIFEALSYFYNGVSKGEDIKQIKRNECDDDIIVTLTFASVQSGIQKMKNEKNKESIQKQINSDTLDELMVVRKERSDRVLIVDGVEKKNPTGFDKAFNDLLPKFEHIDARKHSAQLGGYKKSNEIGKLLSSVIEQVANGDESYQDFMKEFNGFFDGTFKDKVSEIEKGITGFVQEQFSDCKNVAFNIGQPNFEDLLKKFDIQLDDGVNTKVEEKGDGMQRALMLAIIRYYSEQSKANDNGKNIVFCIDEAELHLHPLAQRSLNEALVSITNKENADQVFINTHSSVLITQDSENQKLFKVEKNNGITDVCEVNNKQDIIYDLLGGMPSDLLFPDNFLIVEGDSEEIFIKNIINKFYQDKPTLQIINAKGDGNVKNEKATITRIYANLSNNNIYKDRFIVLMDKSNDGKENKEPLNTLGDRLFVLVEKGLEKYYPQKYQREFKHSEKPKYANEVSKIITQEELEQEMTVIFNALKKCWDNAYKSKIIAEPNIRVV
jgi:putative ATP-dependent endonuclease of OLD family